MLVYLRFSRKYAATPITAATATAAMIATSVVKKPAGGWVLRCLLVHLLVLRVRLLLRGAGAGPTFTYVESVSP